MIGDFMSKFDFSAAKEKAGAMFDGVKEKAANAFNGAKEQAGAMFDGAKERVAKALDFSEYINKAKERFSSMKETVSQTFTAENIGFAIGYALERLQMLPGEAEQYFSQLGTDMETYISEAITNAGTRFDEFITNNQQYFGQLVSDAGTWLSELPGRVGTWYEQTKASASQKLSQMAEDVSKWFSELPGRAETGLNALYTSVSTWCSNIITDVQNWFSKLPGIISNAFEQAAAAVQSRWTALKGWVSEKAGSFSFGFKAGQQTAKKGFANGGFVNRAETVNVAEGNRLEAIIPLDPAKRTRGISLWKQAGAMMGMDTTDGGSFSQQVAQLLQASGGSQLISGISSMQPAFAGAAGLSSTGSSDTPQSGGSSNFTFNGMNISMGNNMSEEDMAIAIGTRILAEIRQSFENRG